MFTLGQWQGLTCVVPSPGFGPAFAAVSGMLALGTGERKLAPMITTTTLRQAHHWGASGISVILRDAALPTLVPPGGAVRCAPAGSPERSEPRWRLTARRRCGARDLDI